MTSGTIELRPPRLAQTRQSHTISLFVKNEPGVLVRVAMVFSRRGYNIESLTVSEVDEINARSRITIVTSGTPMVIEQIKAQLARLVPVYDVHDLTMEGPHVSREMALVKISNTGETRIEALRIADTFRARAIDSTLESFVFELTGDTGKIDAFIDLMVSLGEVEVSRTGVVAIARGAALHMPLVRKKHAVRRKIPKAGGGG